MDVSNASSSSSRQPILSGGYSSSTPVSRAREGQEPAPHVNIPHVIGAFPVDSGTSADPFTISSPSQQRPYTTTNPFLSLIPNIPSSTRPSLARHAISDPRHNRTRRPIQSHGSPIRKPNRRRARTSPNPPDPAPDATARRITAISGYSDDRSQFKTPHEVHTELHDKVLSPLTPTPALGTVYILHDAARPHLFKIGSSQNVRQRRRTIARKCGLTLSATYVSAHIAHYGRVEALAHADLRHLCRPYWCARCGEEHKEWFEVERGVAVKTVERWVGFMSGRPYTEGGKLRGIWGYLLSTRGREGLVGGAWSHDARWRSWDGMLRSPGLGEYCRYWVEASRRHPVWGFAWNFSWQVATMFSWMVTFFALRSFSCFVVLMASIVCSWIHFSSRPLSKIGARGSR